MRISFRHAVEPEVSSKDGKQMHPLLQALLAGTVLLILTTLRAQAPPTEKTCDVRGRVADPLGAAISRAFVLVHSSAWVKTTQVTLTDNGEFSLQLKPGIYAFFADAVGFVPIAKIIDTRSCKPVTLNVKMQVDLAHMED
jgi:hypothetical protein